MGMAVCVMAVGMGVIMPVAVIVVMAMIMLVLVKCQRALGAKAEQRAVFRRIRHHARGAFAADMAVSGRSPDHWRP